MLRQGSIVMMECLDEAGRNPKVRSVLVVSSDEDIAQGRPLLGVAVTSTFPKPEPEYCIPLPWQRSGHPKTKLDRPSVAQCKSVVPVPASAVVSGTAPSDRLVRVLETLRRLSEEP